MIIKKKFKQLFVFIHILIAIPTAICAQTSTLIAAGDIWKYLDDGSNQNTNWQTLSFNDSTWAQGNAELGYGDNDETTVVSYGSNPNNTNITTYFRKTIHVSNPSVFTTLNLELLRDDGAVVYINGIEVARSNMPSGAVSFQTLASNGISWPNENSWHTFTLSPLYLISGTNVIAVEIHQSDATSSDISFNLKLEGVQSTQTANIDRGAYLQIATPNSIVIKWRTDIATDSKILYGTSLNNLTQQVVDYDLEIDHEVELTGLLPATVYYYSIGNNTQTLQSAATSIYFKTSPLVGTVAPYRFWVIGDAGMGNNNQRSVRDGFYGYNNNQHIDGWIMLGDNAYGNGTNDGNQSCYQTGVFQNMYESTLKNTVLWPALGNHDYNNHIPFSPSPAYFDIFTLPTNAEAGGVASGTEKYYSYNYGNIHFIVLDSYDENRATNGAMAQWLQNDLASDTMMWTIAYWHHPPYTKGSHDSDNPNLLDGELVEMRENILPILEGAGVDLVLNGHSHCYERSYLLDGHYGYTTQLQASMIIDSTSGSYPASCAYHKQTQESKAHKGAVYSVVGCSGKLSGTSSGWPHPVMYKATNTNLGSMLLEINGNQLDAKFILTDSTVYDSFTIMKNIGEKKSLNVCAGDQIVLYPSFGGSATWSNTGTTADSLIITAQNSDVYVATQPVTCAKDTFIVNVDNSPSCITGIINTNKNILDINIFPSPANENVFVKINGDEPQTINISLFDVFGKNLFIKQIECYKKEEQISVSTENFKSGIYTIEITGSQTKVYKKFSVLKN
ncbi:MAG: metallophosphoesterase [Bacteroidia bacterium]